MAACFVGARLVAEDVDKRMNGIAGFLKQYGQLAQKEILESEVVKTSKERWYKSWGQSLRSLSPSKLKNHLGLGKAPANYGDVISDTTTTMSSQTGRLSWGSSLSPTQTFRPTIEEVSRGSLSEPVKEQVLDDNEDEKQAQLALYNLLQ